MVIRRVVAAPDKFKGTASAEEIARSIDLYDPGEGWTKVDLDMID